MCHYITLVAPTEDVAALREVMERHGRAAHPIANPSVKKVLRGDERQYLTARASCDCGTILAHQPETSDEVEERLGKEAARLRRKGWSEAKIARAMEERRRADARPGRPGPDSIELWKDVMRDLGHELKVSHVGFLVRLYSGALDTEVFNATRRDVPKGAPWDQALASMAADEVTIFRLG